MFLISWLLGRIPKNHAIVRIEIEGIPWFVPYKSRSQAVEALLEVRQLGMNVDLHVLTPEEARVVGMQDSRLHGGYNVLRSLPGPGGLELEERVW